MDDSDFLDLIYSKWASTTGAENMFWMYEEISRGYDTLWEVYAVDQEQEQRFVASFNSDEDADFITAVHGCFPDLIRKTREALDEADRLDTERDVQEGRIAELELEVDELNQRLLSYGERIKEQEATSEGLAIENREMERRLEVDPADISRWDALGVWLDNGGHNE